MTATAADEGRETSSEKRRRTQERTQDQAQAAVPEPRVDILSREPKGQSFEIVCRMLLGHNGEKLPNGRETYQARFRTLVNYEQVRSTTVFSKFPASSSGKQTFCR